MVAIPFCITTDHFMCQQIVESFARGLDTTSINISEFKDSSKTFATYGILRGTGDLLKKSKNFFYIDHGYFNASQRSFGSGRTIIHDLEGYFRIVKNDFYHSGDGSCDSNRFNKLNIEIQSMRTKGEFIVLSEPSPHIKKFFQLDNWTINTINELKKYTDRKIIVHNKQSPIPLNALLKKAWAFVSEQSTAGIKAMIAGVPSHFTNKTLKKINSISSIENGKIDKQIFYNLSYGQWTLDEMKSGEAWQYLKQNSK